ncbi:MAG: VWA domain-containing protein [Candidatus Brocadiales bacterium]|nr:VWA domain-containing protein [Candidatus Bathyanammoxibius amoris]
MGILNPLALVYLPLIGLLVLMYLFRKKHKTVLVPSFIPWRGLRQDHFRTKAFLVDALFFLQLIALLLLIFFLMRPYLPSVSSGVIGRDIIVLIDTSASMQTLEGGQTRFQLAREEALNLVDEMGVGDKMQIIAMHTRPRIVNKMSGNKDELRELISGLEPLDTSTNLEEALSLGISLLRHSGNGEMHVLTDTEDPGQLDSNVRYVNLGGPPKDNVAITGLDVYQDMFKEYREREAYISVGNFSDKPKRVILKSYLEHTPMTEQVVELLPREEKVIRIRDIVGPGLLKVELTPDDALGVDNSAYAIIKHKKTLNALVVTEERLFIEEIKKIENATAQVKFSVVPPASYKPEMVKDYDIMIFHQFVPKERPDANALFIFPPKDNNLFPVEGWTRGASFIDWDTSSPVLRHLDYMEELWAYKALHLKPDEHLKPFIMAAGTEEDFPLALVGTVDGDRVVVLGFDVADFNLSKAKNMPILIMLLNIIQWLNPYGADTYQIKTGEPFTVDLKGWQGAEKITLLTPEGETVEMDAAGDEVVITDTYQSGMYALRKGENETRFVANLFDVRESDTKPLSLGQEQKEFKEAVASTYVEEKRWELGRYILAFVALLLLAEWILYCLRARSALT